MGSDARIKEIIDSDDELPDFYTECSVPPAYKDDYRFNTADDSSVASEESIPSGRNSEESLTRNEEVKEINGFTKKKLISEGMLSKRDIFIVKSIIDLTTVTTLAWFITYLQDKSINKKYVGCLVIDINDYCVTNLNISSVPKDYCLKLVTRSMG